VLTWSQDQRYGCGVPFVKFFFNVQFISNIRMDTCADPQGHMCILYQRLCGFLRRRWTCMDAFSSWPMMMRASEPPMKLRLSAESATIFMFMTPFIRTMYCKRYHEAIVIFNRNRN
jgi:hypothetical protein